MSSEVTPAVVNVAVTITQFRAFGGIFPISATYTVSSTSPKVKAIGGNIIIKGNQPASLVFALSTPEFVFVGASFNAPENGVDLGSTEFPRVVIDRSAKVNSLTITDANDPGNVGKAYSYLLLVQSAATGDIGMIDPNIINEPGP